MSIPSLEEKLNSFRERYEDEHSCKCPFCEFDLTSDCEYMVDLTTYHGEEGKLEQTCPNCDKDFFVEEHVDRTWNVHLVESYTCSEEGCDRPAIMQEADDQPCSCTEHFKQGQTNA